VGVTPNGELRSELEIDLPEQLAVGRGSAFVVAGYCYHPRLRTRRVELEVNGERQPVDHFRLPRKDVFDRAGDDGADRFAFRSGFVGMARLEPISSPRDAHVNVVVELGRGHEERATLGSIRLEPSVPGPPADVEFPEQSGARVAICMATYNPPETLLRRQLDSIRAQTHGNWVCVISDDCSTNEGRELLEREIQGDDRFLLSPSSRRLGFYANFERALSMTPTSADFVTLCDQDDYWHPEKLDRLLEGVRDGVQLVYSDARVVDPGGELIHSSYWTERRNNYTNFGSLLLANSITGAASLFRRELLSDVLPFPPALDRPFHDHWLAIIALARGTVSYVDEPLYDYVQHGDAVIGHSMANRRPTPVRQRILERIRNPGDGSRIAYYYKWYQQLLFAEVLRLRCWDRIEPSKRRTLGLLLSADRGVAGIAWLLGRRTRRLWGHDETLDRELVYAYALLRRRALALWTLGRGRPGRWIPRDASIPTRGESP
jgi:glycosyltransferase involved in cell wall biosynthesis